MLCVTQVIERYIQMKSEAKLIQHINARNKTNIKYNSMKMYQRRENAHSSSQSRTCLFVTLLSIYRKSFNLQWDTYLNYKEKFTLLNATYSEGKVSFDS